MDAVTNIPLFTIVLSLFSGVLCTMLPARSARRYTVVWECALIALTGAVLLYTFETGEPFTYVMGEFPAPWGNEIRAGVLEAMMAFLFACVMLCSVLGGMHFIQYDIDESKIHLYYALLNLMTASLMAMIWTNDLFTGYVFLEILTLTSCGILIVREIGRTTLAAVRYMILNLLGSGLFLLGVVLLYDITGNLLMVPMQEEIARLAQDPATMRSLTLSTGILTVGLAIKSGLFPFHYWMPDTYGRATPTSGAVLSSMVSKCYIFLLIKIFYRVIGADVFARMPVRNILFVLGLLAMVFGSVSALRAANINRMVAFSSAAQIGYIFVGIGIGGTAGYTAAIFQIFAHAVTKSMLFLTTPRLAAVSGGSLRFRDLQGAGMRDKSAGMYFSIGAMSMLGIPVFAGFVSKLLLGAAAVTSGSMAKMVLVMLAIALSSMLNALYFIRTMIRLNGESDRAKEAGPVRHGAAYHLPMLFLAAGNLVLGLSSAPVAALIRKGLSMLG